MNSRNVGRNLGAHFGGNRKAKTLQDKIIGLALNLELADKLEEQKKRVPILKIEIDIGPEKDEITLYEGDKPKDLAHRLGNKHGFPKEVKNKIQEKIEQRLSRLSVK